MPDSTQPDSTQPDALPEITGRDRLAAALRTPFSRSQLTAAVLLGVLGFAAVVQVQANDEDDRYRGASQQDLIQLINSQQLAQDRVESQIDSLENTRDALLGDTSDSELALELAQRQAASLGILTGAVPAVGPGVEVTVDGPPGSVGTEELITGIQELRSAGAEAMQLNGSVRLVGQSSIGDGAGDSVRVDGRQIGPPFVLEAIGPPSALEEAVFFLQGFADSVRAAGGDVTVRQIDRLEINTTRQLDSPRFARPQG